MYEVLVRHSEGEPFGYVRFFEASSGEAAVKAINKAGRFDISDLDVVRGAAAATAMTTSPCPAQMQPRARQRCET